MQVRNAVWALVIWLLLMQAGCWSPRDAGNFHLATVAVSPEHRLLFLSSPGSGVVDILRMPRGRDTSLRHVARLLEPIRVRRLAVDASHGRLWVADFASVYAYELDGFTLTRKYDMPANSYYERVSDLTVDRQGNAFVLARGGARIYRIDARSANMDLWLDVGNSARDSGILLANRLLKTVDDRFLILVSSANGALLRIELATKSITPIELNEKADFTCGVLLWNERPEASIQAFDCADQWVARIELRDDHSVGSLQLRGHANPRVHGAVTSFGPY